MCGATVAVKALLVPIGAMACPAGFADTSGAQARKAEGGQIKEVFVRRCTACEKACAFGVFISEALEKLVTHFIRALRNAGADDGG